MANDGIRPARSADAPAVKAVIDMAYHHYIARIAVVPQPMEADHMANGAAGGGDGGCWSSWTHARVPSACPRRPGSARTR